MASVNLDTASRLNITCRRGDTFTLEVDFGEAVNTTGWTLRVKDRQQVVTDQRVQQQAPLLQTLRPQSLFQQKQCRAFFLEHTHTIFRIL